VTAPVVVDASIVVQWFSHEPGSARAARLIQGRRVLVAPDIMPIEAANAWWKKVRRGDMASRDLEQAVSDILAMGLVLEPSLAFLDRAARMSVEIGHPVYDCVYLALSAARGAVLATVDGRLQRGAARLGVNLWQARA
jgi:predicted nucleic acid-binding protein